MAKWKDNGTGSRNSVSPTEAHKKNKNKTKTNLGIMNN